MKVSILTGACVKRDAVSESVRGSMFALRYHFDADIKLFTYQSDFDDFPTQICRSSSCLLTDQHILESDLIIYHFGFYYDMFGLLALGNGHAKQIVRFHNVTPKVLMPAHTHRLIDKSVEQMALIDSADAILADSHYNKSDLIARGIDANRIEVAPLYVKFSTPPIIRSRTRLAGPTRLLYVGRIVQSKGILDLIEALSIVSQQENHPFSLTLAGNLFFSDANYIATLRRRIEQCELSDKVIIEGSPDDVRLRSLYEEADIFVMPSYHEGFCVPILEAFHAGCVPVAANAGNLPFLVGKLGVQYPAGDVTALAAQLKQLGKQFVGAHRDILELSGRSLTWSAYQSEVAELLKSYTYTAYAEKLADTARRVLEEETPPRADLIETHGIPERRLGRLTASSSLVVQSPCT